MKKVMPSKEDLDQLKALKGKNNLPKDEDETVPLVANTYKNSTQFKFNVPKRFANAFGLDKEKHKVQFFLRKNDSGKVIGLEAKVITK